MNFKVSVVLLSGGYGTAFRETYPSLHKSLIPIHNTPSICILIETLLQLEDYIDMIYIVCFRRHAVSFHKEISRRFYNNYRLQIVSVEENQGTTVSFQSFLTQQPNVSSNLCILYSNMPLISQYTLREFMSQCKHQNKVIAVSSLKKNVLDYHKIVTHHDNEREAFRIISRHDTDLPSFDYIFCNLFFIKTVSLLEGSLNLNPHSQEYEIFDILPPCLSDELYIIHSYVAVRECTLLVSTEDKEFIEESYTERKNAFFITQCYQIWKKIESYDHRLHLLEQRQETPK